MNIYGGVLDFVCPGTGYIAGIRSKHNNEREDRIFRFKCCSADGNYQHLVKWSGYLALECP